MILKKKQVQEALNKAKKDAKYFGSGYIKVTKEGETIHTPYMDKHRDDKDTRYKIRTLQERIRMLEKELRNWKTSRP